MHARWKLKFRIKTVLALVFFLCVGLGWWADRIRLQREIEALKRLQAVEASAVEAISKLGARTYQYKGVVAVCFGAMDPPFPAFSDPHKVAVFDANPLADRWYEPRSIDDCPRIVDALQQLDTVRPLVYVDLWKIPFTKDAFDDLLSRLPNTLFVHNVWAKSGIRGKHTST